jgi:diphthamide synthase (EF-2-diphthine--ammonia ligase)
VFPLWQKPTTQLAREMIASGLRARITCLDPRVMPSELAGREFDDRLLSELPPHIDPCGERGEFHTFAYDGPMFGAAVRVDTGETVEREGFVFTDLLAAAPERTARGAGSSSPASSPWR